MTTMYRVTVSGAVSWQKVTRSELARTQVGEAVKSLLDQVGYDLPTVTIERIERRVLSWSEIDQNPSQRTILVLDAWGTHPKQQINKIAAIKALRSLDPGNLGLKEAKDLVEGGGEIFCPWDLPAEVADYLHSGLLGHQLFTKICARDDRHLEQSSYDNGTENYDPISDIPEEHRY